MFLNRRQYLATCAGFASALPGCLAFDSEPTVGTIDCADGTDAPGNDGELRAISADWPTSQFDDRNSSYNPVVSSSPAECARVQWQYSIPTADPDVGGTELLGGPALYDGTLYLSTAEGVLIAIDAMKGVERWRSNLSNRGEDTPTVTDDLVFVGTDGTLDAVDREKGQLEWSAELAERYPEEYGFEFGDEIETAPRVSNGRVFAGTSGGRVRAFDAESGQPLWTVEISRPNPAERPSAENTPTFGQVATAHDSVFAASRNHRLYAFEAATGDRRWAFEADTDLISRAGSAPTIVDQTVYINSETTLYALDAIDGSVKWTYSEGSADTSPVVVDDTIYTALGSSYESLSVVALDRNDRSVKWRLPGRPQDSPSYGNGTLYIGMYGDLVAIDAETGEVSWRLETEGVLDDAPIVADGAVIVSDRDGYVYGIGEP